MHDNHLKCGYSVNVKLGLQIENHQDFVWTEPRYVISVNGFAGALSAGVIQTPVGLLSINPVLT